MDTKKTTRISETRRTAPRTEALEVRTEVRAGADRLSMNDSEVLEVRTELRAGALTYNHSQAPVAPIGVNHSQAVTTAAGSRG